MTRRTAWGLDTPKTEHWTGSAACRGTDPEAFFEPANRSKEDPAVKAVKRICEACPVRAECLTEALDRGEEFGIWGGMTERELRALRIHRPPATRGVSGDDKDLYARLNAWRRSRGLKWAQVLPRLGVTDDALRNLRKGRASRENRRRVRDWLARHQGAA
jgi:WhiB family redox-sensing transcriptional regulator